MLRAMNRDRIESLLLKATGARGLGERQILQRLWSGYGSIVRYQLEGAERSTVVVKHVSPPSVSDHPRGWNSDLSHQRKLKSYVVETAWYRDYAGACSSACRVPECYVVESEGDEVVILLEDMDAAGFPSRCTGVSDDQLFACLSWLAHFHARFIGQQPEGLWEVGTYWHLDTRPDELKVLARDDRELYAAADLLDQMLRTARFQTLVHGDAKLANFCFATAGDAVAAVDFQYVGAGCGMKDVAYFLGSCLTEVDCERMEGELLDLYFSVLRTALDARSDSWDTDALESEWRSLYPVAWTDFHRFLKGGVRAIGRSTAIVSVWHVRWSRI